ncbi:PAS domain S-box protein [Paludisphaera soli]|uniref:PAS domain S-box protein n=1 Tax=Paludisphaera soli TaxID=2712865 RepID=UPI0013ECDBBD|nr:PAS domain S-box protein [Paludisphaera soli]
MGGESERNNLLGVGALALLVVVNGTVSYRKAETVRFAAARATRAEEVLVALADLRADARDEAWPRVREGVARLATLAADDPVQAARVAALEAGIVASNGRGLPADAARAIEDDAKARLARRRGQVDSAYADAIRFGAAAVVSSLLAIAAAGWLLIRGAAVRRRTERERARLADIVQSSDDAIIAESLAGVVESWNPGAEALFGYTAEEMIGRPIDPIIPPDRRDEERLILGRIARGERLEHFDTARLTKDGRLVDVSVSVSPIRHADGRVAAAAKVVRDVTGRREVEARAREAAAANAKFRTLFEQGFQFAGVLSTDGVLVEANRACLAFCGFTRDEVLGRPFWECGWWDRSPELVEMVRDACERAAAGEAFRGESPYFLADGSMRHVDMSIAPVVDEEGRVLFLSPTGVDVTDRRRAEDALRESEAQLREFADAAPAMLWATDEAGWCTFLSRGWYEFTGQGEEEGLGFGWLAAVHPEDRPTAEAAFRDALARRGAYSFEHRLRRADGSYGWVIDAGRPRISAEGAFQGHVGSVIEISDRKAGEESLRRSEERYRTLFTSIDQGFCVVEVLFEEGRGVDYRFVEANPVFESQTGLKEPAGRRALELVPDLEPHWAEAYGRVARTGEPVRFLQESPALGRWFDVYAFRIGEAGGDLVAILFTDVSERKRDEEERERLHRHVAYERERLAEAFERSPAFVAVLRGPDHVYERANPRYVQLVGRRDLLGRPIREVVPEVEDQGYFEILDRVFRTGRPYVAVDRPVRLARGHGGAMEDRWLDFVFQALHDPDGRISGILIHGIDLTDRKRAEDQLREKDQRLQLLLDNAADYAVVITDPEGVVVDWAGGAEAITGFAPHEVLGRPIEFLFTPEDRASGVPARERAAAAREGRAEDRRWHLRRDGSEFFGEGVQVPLRDEAGLHGFGKVLRDATARKRAEESVRFLADASASLAELVDHESTLRRIANLAVVGFADWCAVDVLDPAGARRRLAVARADRLEDPPDRGADPTGRESDEVAGVIPHVLRTGEPEVVFDLADLDPEAAAQGPARIARLRGLGVRSYLCVPLLSRGRVVGGISFLSASGRRRFGPDELRLAQDLAERVAVAVENAQLYRALQETDRRKDEFLATLAHELRNPLAPVRNGMQILRLGPAAGEARERTLGMMDRQLAHLVRLVDDLMDVSRVTSGKVVLRRERVELREIVEAAVETSRQMIDGGGHELVVRVPEGPLPLDADRTRLVQVVSNLLNNAAKYTPQGGRIEVSAALEGAAVAIRVADDGIGVPAEMLPRIFDMFTQVGASLDRAQGGLGIGLTLVRRLVELHGGSVSAESAGAGKGSAFLVRLPLALDLGRDPDRRAVVRAADPSAEGDAGPGAGRVTILVVDDNRDSAESLAALLTMKGHEVRTAHDGPEALRVLADFRPRLVLLDLGLPGMSGYEVARRVRESPALRGVELAALTGWGQDEDRRRTREAGFNHHLVKPADPVAVEAILAGLEPPAPDREGPR